MKIVTVGVYGFSEEGFFETLRSAGVDVFCDVRWRRGVRGADYAFANRNRLQKRLEAMGIVYLHRRDLAPTPEIRGRQYDEDKKNRVAKRKRDELSSDFIAMYCEDVLSEFDPTGFISTLPEGTEVLALFCVERNPQACHRSLLAEKLEELLDMDIEHLLPIQDQVTAG